MALKPQLTARFQEGASVVDLSLQMPGVGTQESSVPLPVFMTSLAEWARGGEMAPQVDDNSTRISAAVNQPEKWQVNGLASPLKYALCVEGDWKLAVGLRSPSIMNLRFRYDDEDEDSIRTLAYAVPARLIAGVWLKNSLRAGIIALAENFTDLPMAPTDALHTVTPFIWGNVNGEGQICFGSTTRPQWGQDGVTTIERAFFDSVFNEHICRFPYPRDEDGERERDYHNLLTYHEAEVESDEDVVVLPVSSQVQAPRTLGSMLSYSIRSGW